MFSLLLKNHLAHLRSDLVNYHDDSNSLLENFQKLPNKTLLQQQKHINIGDAKIRNYINYIGHPLINSCTCYSKT